MLAAPLVGATGSSGLIQLSKPRRVIGSMNSREGIAGPLDTMRIIDIQQDGFATSIRIQPRLFSIEKVWEQGFILPLVMKNFGE